MTRPAILDMDMAVAPRKSVPLPYDLQDDFCDDPSCEHGCAEMRQERDEFNRKHNGPDPAWDDVRKYVEGLEAGHKAVSDFVRVRIPDDQNKDQADCYLAHIGLICRLEERAEAAEARIAELEKKLSESDALIQAQQHDFAQNNIRNAENAHNVAELEKEKHAAITMIAMLEKRLAYAERVIEPFARLGTMSTHSINEDGTVSFSFFRTADMSAFTDARRAARAYMEGK